MALKVGDSIPEFTFFTLKDDKVCQSFADFKLSSFLTA